MWKFPQEQRQKWAEERGRPSNLKRKAPVLQLKMPLLKYPRTAEEPWTKKDFLDNGCFFTPKPDKAAGLVDMAGLEQLIKERQEFREFSKFEREQLEILKELLGEGAPASEVPLEPGEVPHHLNSEELKYAIDTLQRYSAKGFAFGPLDEEEWLHTRPHFISTFTRYQKSNSGVRVITDCSQPKGRSYNDSTNLFFVKKYPYKMATPEEVIRKALRFGPAKLLVIKIDVCDAFKIIAVRESEWPRQSIKIGNCVWVNTRLIFGANNAPHTFVFFHQKLQEIFIFPFLQESHGLTTHYLSLAIDDSTLRNTFNSRKVSQTPRQGFFSTDIHSQS